MVFGAPYHTRLSPRSWHLASRWRRPTPRSAQRSSPSRTTTCSSAVCGTRRRRAGAAPDLVPSSAAAHLIAHSRHHPCASLPRCEVLDLRGSRPGWAAVVLRTAAPSHAARTYALPARAPTAHRGSPSPHGYLSFSCTTSCAAPTARSGLAARLAFFLSFLRVPTLFLGRPFFLSFCSFLLARSPPARTRLC